MVLFLTLLSCQNDAPEKDGGPGPTPPVGPGALRVGVASARMPVPIGIGTAGYGGFTTNSETPFSEIYPGTTGLYQHPDLTAFAVSRGDGYTLVFVRSDTVGVFQQLRRAVVLEVEQRTGQDLDAGLVIGATHTHSGPGRVVDGGGLYDLITDVFFPEFYEHMVHAMADVVVAALDDLAPGRVGLGRADTDAGHDDRRCEDGLDHENGALPIIALEQEGEVVGVILDYAVHGTVLGIDDLTLSQDVSGGIEQAVADRFDHPVTVAMFNSWAADMSPADHPVVTTAVPGWQVRIPGVGEAVADAVEGALDDLEWTDEPDMASATYRVAIDREAIGYPADVFPYPYGGVYCSAPPEDCDPSTTADSLDHNCLGFTAEYPAPNQTELTAGHLGDLHFVTFPGEPGTLLAEQIVAALEAEGAGQVAFFGYSQDYLGYSILEEDWWQGGYEASGALWGPQQGEYLAARTVDAWRWAHGKATPPDDLPAPIAPFDDPVYDPYVPETPVDAGSVAVDVPSAPAPDTLVELVVRGLDPWLGAPVATIVDEGGAALVHPTGAPWTSDDLPFAWRLEVVPPYGEAASRREFRWHLTFPTTHEVPGAALPLGGGAHRVHVELPDGAVVESAPFTVGG